MCAMLMSASAEALTQNVFSLRDSWEPNVPSNSLGSPRAGRAIDGDARGVRPCGIRFRW